MKAAQEILLCDGGFHLHIQALRTAMLLVVLEDGQHAVRGRERLDKVW